MATPTKMKPNTPVNPITGKAQLFITPLFIASNNYLNQTEQKMNA